MAGEAAEVRVKLVFDAQAANQSAHQASGELKNISGGAKDAGDKMKESGGAGAFAMGALGGAVALMGEKMLETFHRAEDSVKDFIGEAMGAAEEAVQEEKAITGVLSMIDGAGHSLNELQGYASDLHEELEGIGIEAGVSTDAIQEAFNGIAVRTSHTVDEVMHLTDAMATAGKAVPGGIGALSSGFEAMEMGVIRARNPIVSLIASTGLLHGNAKSVAAQLQKMSPEAAMKLGEKAIDAMATKMEKAPQSFTGLIQSLKDVQHNVMEATGRPILDHLNPELEKLKGWLMQHSEQIEHYATIVGEEIGRVVTFVSGIFEGIYEGITSSEEDIKAGFEEIFGEWYRAWGQASDHTDGIKGSFKDITHDLIAAFIEISRYLKAAAEVAMDANDLIHGRSAGTTQANIQYEALKAQTDNVGNAKSTSQFDDSAAQYRFRALDAGQDEAAVDKAIELQKHAHEANMQAAEQAKALVESQSFEAFSGYLQSAIDIHAKGQTAYALSMIAGSEQAQRAMLDGSIHIEGGLEALKKVIEENSPELAAKMKDLLHPKLDIKPAQPTVNFNNNTFNIKQDFREQDPDRIAIVFRKDVANSATSRVQSKVATPFGF